MSAPAYSVDDYLAALQSMLPRGRAWPRDADAPLTMALRGLAQGLSDATARANNLLTVAFPATVDDMLPEWNETLGLPGLTGYTGSDLPTQQAQVVAAFTDAGGQSAAYFIGLAAALGIPITINGYRPYRVNDHVNDPITGQPWAHVWRVNVAAGYDDSVLVTLFNLYKPAHTTVIFAEAAAPPPPPPPGTPSTLLIHFDSGEFVDSSANGLTVRTSSGSETTSADSRYGNGSMLSDGTDYIRHISVDDEKINLLANDFTIDCWFKSNNNSGQEFIMDSRNGGSQYDGLCIYINGGNLYWYDGAISYAGVAYTLNVWNHVELCRSAGTVYFFLNGELVATNPGLAGSFDAPLMVIGAALFTPPGVNTFSGLIDEFHVINGTAQDTSAFTPRAAAYTD